MVSEVTVRRQAANEGIVSALPPGRGRGLETSLTAFADAADEPARSDDPVSRFGW